MDGASGGSPQRRWDRAGSQASRPHSLTSASLVSAASSLGGGADAGAPSFEERDAELQRLAKEKAPVRQLQQEVSDVGARCKALAEAMEQFRSATERRLEFLAASIGGSANSPISHIGGSGGGSSAADRFLLHTTTSPKGSRASVEDRLNHIESALGESAAEKRGSPLSASTPKSFSDLDWQPAAVRQRIAFLETLIGDSADNHTQTMADAMSTRSKLLADRKDRKTTNAQHTSLRERIDYVEEVVGDSAQKHARELAAAHAKLDLFAVRVATCEAAKDHVSQLKEAHANLSQEHAEKHATMKQRLDYLEKLIGDSADKHAKELAKAKAEHSATHSKLVSQCKEQVDSVHRALGESIQKHAQEIEKVQMAHAKLAGDVAGHGKSHAATKSRLEAVASEKDALTIGHASIGERVKALERKVGSMQPGQREGPKALFGSAV